MRHKFCINCDHYKEDDEGSICLHPELEMHNLITGAKIPTYCQNQRREGAECGLDGQFHETDGELTR